MPRNYKKLKKKLKKKLQKIKNYKISDNKLAALVFIVTAVLGARIGNYIRFFAYQKEKEQNDPYEPYSEYSNLYSEPEPQDWEVGRSPDDESKGDDDPDAGAGAYDVSLFGKNKNKKIALASILGGTLGVGTGYYLRDKFYKKLKKNEKEISKNYKDDEEYEEIKRLLELNDKPPTNSEYSEGIKFDFEDFNKNFEEISKNDKDDEDFEIKSYIDPGTTGLEEEEDFMRAMEALNESKKKLKEDKKKTKKEKRILSRNKDVKERVNIIKEQIKNNEKQSEELKKIYDDYVDNKEKRLTKRQLSNLLLKGKDKKDIVKLMSEEAGEDPNNLKYFTLRELEQMLKKYPFWKLQKIYDNQKAKEEHQIYIQELLNYQEKEPVQEVMLFGKKKRKRRKKKRK
jgi:hypothetical protein